MVNRFLLVFFNYNRLVIRGLELVLLFWVLVELLHDVLVLIVCLIQGRRCLYCNRSMARVRMFYVFHG